MVPNWLYQPLPAIYVIAGFLIMYAAGPGFFAERWAEMLLFLSGLLMAMVGVIVLGMRQSFRYAARAGMQSETASSPGS
jgi:hypothetical protein